MAVFVGNGGINVILGGNADDTISGLGGNGTTSPSSPLGVALIGRRVGETVDVQAPKSTWQATIVEIRAA